MTDTKTMHVVVTVDHVHHRRGAIVEMSAAEARKLIASGIARPYDADARTKRDDKWSPRLTTR